MNYSCTHYNNQTKSCTLKKRPMTNCISTIVHSVVISEGERGWSEALKVLLLLDNFLPPVLACREVARGGGRRGGGERVRGGRGM